MQGIEWVLSIASGVQFRVSADNLHSPVPSTQFIQAIFQRSSMLIAQQAWPTSWRDLVAQLCIASGRSESELKSDPAFALDSL